MKHLRRPPLGAGLSPCRILLQGLLFCLLLHAGNVMSHPGPLDQNGGHYDGQSYHCHMPDCEMPDSFFRSGQDSFFFDPRTREQFFNEVDWDYSRDYDGDCQTTRHEILFITSRAPVGFTNPRNCEVRTGEWFDEYTGKTFTVAAQIDIDHVIPLRYAHNQGGDAWPPEKKLMFANDPANIVLTERSEIRRKNDRGPSRYLPREEYQCSYVRQWQALAEKYDLRLANADRNRITVILRDCGE